MGSVFRTVYTGFWNDSTILEEFTPEGRYFFTYLLTNPMTTQIGIYEITKKQMAFQLGYSEESVNVLLDLFESKYKIIKYNPKTRELAIKNWGKYNLNRGGKPFIDCIVKELEGVNDKSLISYVLNSIRKAEIKSIFESYIKEDYSLEYEEVHNQNKNTLGEFSKYYEKNVGIINSVVGIWLSEISEKIDFELFKRAVEIATDKGKVNKGYINGIIKQWLNNNINTFEKLVLEEKKEQRSIENGGYKNERYTRYNTKSRYATECEDEDDSIYTLPTEEELEAIRNL